MTDLPRALLETRSAVLADVATEDGTDRLLVRSDLSGTMQLYELSPSGSLRPVTDLPEPVGAAAYVPGRRQAVIQVDRGGDERHQLHLVDLDAPLGGPGQLIALTNDLRYGHHLAGVSPDGKTVAYLSNRTNGVNFDVWVCDVADGSSRSVYAGEGWCQPSSGYSPDGRWLSVLRPGPRPLDTDLLLVEIDTGDVRIVFPHPDEAAEVGSPVWWDDTTIFVSSTVGRDTAAIVRHDLSTGGTTEVAAGDWETWAAAGIAGSVITAVENRNGSSRLMLLDPARAERTLEVPLIEAGVVMSHLVPRPALSADGTRLYYTLSTPRRPSDVWAYDRRNGESRRLTTSPAAADPDQLVSAEPVEVSSFDGERIPLFLYRPPKVSTPPPVVVLVHGGPEGQSVLSFNPIVQSLPRAGYAVVVPNVRGSTGYGKRYAGLDDTIRRLDSVRDLASVHAWLGSAELDGERAALWGGSYGGYMVLAGLAFQPDLWAAGVDIVGISDLVTFLENTSDYRRAHREREYGSLLTDRDFLATASPLRHADAIHAPLFMIHGRNDPRVPVGETEQLAARLHERGVRCELVIYDDEGHGLARLDNRLDAYLRALRFLDEVLQPCPL